MIINLLVVISTILSFDEPLYIIAVLILLILSKFNIKTLLIILVTFLYVLIYNSFLYEQNVEVNDTITFTTSSNIKQYDSFYADNVKINFKKYNVTFNYEQTLEVGEIVSCSIDEISNIENSFLNPSSFDLIKYNKSKGIVYSLELKNCRNIGRNNNLIYKLESIRNELIVRNQQYYTNYSTINALAFGNKDFDDETLELFKENSIMHLITISGAHLITLISFLNFICLKFKIPYNLSNIPISFILLIYFIFSGGQIPMQRATSFAILKSIFTKFDSTKLLISIFLFMLILNPFYALNIGFILTFLISFVIMNYKISKIKITLLILLITFPLTINLNYEINIFSFLSILIVTPLISFILLPLSLFSSLCTFFSIKLNLIDFVFNIFYKFLNYITIDTFIIGSLSILSIILFYLSLYFLFKYKNIIFIILILIITFSNHVDFNPKIHFIDINQGKAIIITLPFKKTIVVDSGSEKYSNELVKYLKHLGISKIDHYFITHKHEDHYGGTNNLINNFTIKNIYSSFELPKSTVLKCDDTLKINTLEITILNPCKFSNNPNNMSLVLYIKTNKFNILLTGDIEKEIEAEILMKYKNIKVDILDVPHHGSSTSSSENFIKSINPKVAVIQAGKNNMFGHPSNQTITTLSKFDILIYEVSKKGVLIYNI